MGYGDWIIATGQVREIYAKRAIPVLILGRNNRPQWSEVFENNPKITRDSRSAYRQLLINGSGLRPYIGQKTTTQWHWRKYRPPKGELFFSPAEREFGAAHGGAVMIEPTSKAIGHTNKQWIDARWQELVDSLPDVPFVQCGPDPNKSLRGVRFVRTNSFRAACSVLAYSKAFVGTEGGLMHAAAAVDTPAVILWSEFIEPAVTGYDFHRNIRHAGPACGMRVTCGGCVKSMQAITVDEVRAAVLEKIGT